MNKKDFINYFFGFYGSGGLYNSFFPKGITKKDIAGALEIRLKNKKVGFVGDSFDRELVRDIMLYQRGKRDTEYPVAGYFSGQIID